MQEINNMYTKIYLQWYWIKTVWFYSMERTRFGTWKTRTCQIFCLHFQSAPHNQNIKKIMFDNEFYLLINEPTFEWWCLIRHHYPISHAQYLTHTESKLIDYSESWKKTCNICSFIIWLQWYLKLIILPMQIY